MKPRNAKPVHSSSALHWMLYTVGLRSAQTQTTSAEQACLLRHARDRRQLVEIGVYHGRTLGQLRSVMHPNGVLTGIDPHPPGRLGVSFERWVTQSEISRSRNGKVELLQAFSHDAAHHWRREIDFLFVDGDHRWEGIERDWNQWSGFVSPNGIVALHDTRSVDGRTNHDSVRFMQEVISKDPRFETIDEVETLTVLQRRAA